MNDGEDMDLTGGDFVDQAVLAFDDFTDVRILILSDHLSGHWESSQVPRTRRDPVDHPLRIASGITGDVLVNRRQMPNRSLCPSHLHSGNPN